MYPRALPCPGCGCEACLVLTTNFNGANSASVPGFTEVVGTAWQILSNDLVTTAPGILICDTAIADGHGIVEASGNASADNDILWLIGSYVDVDNFVYLKVKFHASSSSAQCTLWKRDTGTDSQLSEADILFALTGGTNVTMKLCWDGTDAKARVLIGTTFYHFDEPYTGTGTKAGVGFEGAGTGTWSAFTLSRHKVDNAECEECLKSCGNACITDPPTMSWSVVIPTMSNNSSGGHCNNCEDYAATYDVDDLKQSTPTFCIWRLAIGDICDSQSGDEYIEVLVFDDGTFDNVWITIVGVSGFTNVVQSWAMRSDNINWPGSCAGFSSTAMPENPASADELCGTNADDDALLTAT